MRGGGAERVVSRMANYWAAKNWPTTLLTLFHGHDAPSYALDARVRYHDVRWSKQARLSTAGANALQALKATFHCASAPERRLLLAELDVIVTLRHTLQRMRPDIVISFID